METKRFMIFGGDSRNIQLGELLRKDGHQVKMSHIEGMNFSDSDIIIGPLPLSYDNETVNAPFHNEKIPLENTFDNMNKNHIFIVGKIPDEYIKKGKELGIDVVDYFKREELQVLNAVPTAEGAIKVAMENSVITIHSSNVLVLGFGRIGKVLAKMLHGIGANVYVAARKPSHMAWISDYGYKPVYINKLDQYVDNMDFIFNTIPSKILTKEILENINKDTLIVDVASNPGGVDYKWAEKLGLKAIHASGLPGKVAPLTAAKIIRDTIYNIIEERGI